MAQTQVFRGTARNIYTQQDGSVEFWYHSTCVCIIRADKSVRLHSGGWRTATTKTAINQALNQSGLNHIGVFQKKGEWFVSVGDSVLAFFDGIEIKG